MKELLHRCELQRRSPRARVFQPKPEAQYSAQAAFQELSLTAPDDVSSGGRKMKTAKWISIALLGCLVLASAINLFGQANTTASLQGTVTDKSQAVLKGAEVTITNKDTGESRTVRTNDIGEYRV